MSFLSKKDYFNVAGDGNGLTIVSSDENKSTSVAEAINDKGDVVKQEVYGEMSAPSCSYVVHADAALENLTLGEERGATSSTRGNIITNVSISTGAGSPPTVQVSGESANGVHCSEDCYYEVPEATLEPCHHAQALWGISWASIGSGFYVTQANYTAECSLTKATKDGETVAWDIIGGKLTATLTIQGTGTSGTPSISATGWTCTSPMSLSNPDSGYETYSVTYTKNLAHTEEDDD